MILSEQARRWSEIKFYYFCLDLYHINNDMMEVILMIEAISHIGRLNFKLLKTITVKMLGDPYYLPIKDEAVSIAKLYGLSITEISKQFNLTRKSVRVILDHPNRNAQNNPTPLLSIEEDQELYKFCKVITKIQEAGIYEKDKN